MKYKRAIANVVLDSVLLLWYIRQMFAKSQMDIIFSMNYSKIITNCIFKYLQGVRYKAISTFPNCLSIQDSMKTST